nr:LysE family transporter [Phaeovibrio sulfidiphilus]
MSADTLLFLVSPALLAVSLCYTPGPNNTLALATGLERGVAAAAPLALGSALGANLSLLALGYGLGEVFRLYPFALEGLRVAGTVYLLWLAWRISGLRLPSLRAVRPGRWIRRPALVPARPADGSDPGPEAMADPRGQARVRLPGFFGGFLLQQVNIKAWITNLIIVSTYVQTGEGRELRLWLIAALFTVAGIGAVFVWAALGALMRRFLTAETIRRANYVFALFLVLSVLLLYLDPL